MEKQTIKKLEEIKNNLIKEQTLIDVKISQITQQAKKLQEEYKETIKNKKIIDEQLEKIKEAIHQLSQTYPHTPNYTSQTKKHANQPSTR